MMKPKISSILGIIMILISFDIHADMKGYETTNKYSALQNQHILLQIGGFSAIQYRFFYLDQSHLKKDNNEIINYLTTGNSYANALVFSLSL